MYLDKFAPVIVSYVKTMLEESWCKRNKENFLYPYKLVSMIKLVACESHSTDVQVLEVPLRLGTTAKKL